MSALAAVVGAVSVADSLFVALNPQAWARFWGNVLDRIAHDRRLAIGIGLTELTFGLWFMRWTGAPRRHA